MDDKKYYQAGPKNNEPKYSSNSSAIKDLIKVKKSKEAEVLGILNEISSLKKKKDAIRYKQDEFEAKKSDLKSKINDLRLQMPFTDLDQVNRLLRHKEQDFTHHQISRGNKYDLKKMQDEIVRLKNLKDNLIPQLKRLSNEFNLLCTYFNKNEKELENLDRELMNRRAAKRTADKDIVETKRIISSLGGGGSSRTTFSPPPNTCCSNFAYSHTPTTSTAHSSKSSLDLLSSHEGGLDTTSSLIGNNFNRAISFPESAACHVAAAGDCQPSHADTARKTVTGGRRGFRDQRFTQDPGGGGAGGGGRRQRQSRRSGPDSGGLPAHSNNNGAGLIDQEDWYSMCSSLTEYFRQVLTEKQLLTKRGPGNRKVKYIILEEHICRQLHKLELTIPYNINEIQLLLDSLAEMMATRDCSQPATISTISASNQQPIIEALKPPDSLDRLDSNCSSNVTDSAFSENSISSVVYSQPSSIGRAPVTQSQPITAGGSLTALQSPSTINTIGQPSQLCMLVDGWADLDSPTTDLSGPEAGATAASSTPPASPVHQSHAAASTNRRWRHTPDTDISRWISLANENQTALTGLKLSGANLAEEIEDSSGAGSQTSVDLEWDNFTNDSCSSHGVPVEEDDQLIATTPIAASGEVGQCSHLEVDKKSSSESSEKSQKTVICSSELLP